MSFFLVTMGKVTDNGLDKSKSCGKFIYTDDRHARWKGKPNVFLHGYWTHDWSDDTLRVKAIDTTKKEITLADRHGYGLDARRHGRGGSGRDPAGRGRERRPGLPYHLWGLGRSHRKSAVRSAQSHRAPAPDGPRGR